MVQRWIIGLICASVSWGLLMTAVLAYFQEWDSVPILLASLVLAVHAQRFQAHRITGM
jgi:hypothetical protein